MGSPVVTTSTMPPRLSPASFGRVYLAHHQRARVRVGAANGDSSAAAQSTGSGGCA